MIQFRGHFDGKNICPDEPVSLPEGVSLRVKVTEEPAEQRDSQSKYIDLEDLFAQLDPGPVDEPSDWSAEHDHYLYGAPKKSNG